jgi:putative ATPase
MLGVAQLREILAEARSLLEADGTRTILFLDEIHRFARNQQDVLLHDVEQGYITLIGATTENPAFTVNNALISRSTVCRLQPLEISDLAALITVALEDERGFGHLPVLIDDDAATFLAHCAGGDARRLLSALEVAVLWQAQHAQATDETIHIDLDGIQHSTQERPPQYDRSGDSHFDVASALIKSIRGSDVDASVYWLAKMLEAGEDPRFIARRLAILASEDIGLADPHAMTLAASAWTIVERIGMPEGQLTLSQLAIYLALAPKSNAAATAIWSAMEDVRTGEVIDVPLHLRDGHSGVSKSMGHGQGYIYPHDEPSGHCGQDHLGADRTYYTPTDRGQEAKFQERLKDVTRKRGTSSDEPRSDPPS